MVSEHSPPGIMAGDKGGGKEARGAQLKKVESLETELGHLYARMENQGHQIQQNAESIASLQLKMDQMFEEILGAIAKSRPTINNEKKTMEGEPSNTPVLSIEETPRVYSRASHTDTGGSRNGTGGGFIGRGGGYIPKGEYRGGTNQRFHKHEMILFDGTNTEEWIFNIERSFCSYEDDETMEVAVGALAGDTLLWYEWEHRRQPIRDWEELKGLIRRRFGSS
ncbi:unnamed protein product [Lactuca saligna]|uniref:Retrotransposon gag domain-containing protein n=1 Tax=Lactuca saligna TaxID=75948 RepID=A0AA35ZVD2_LACSI|nr:unnamed protein product [Lactuca saligna]